MKKVFPLAILLLLATWGGASWVISNQVEQNYDRAVAQANAKLQQDLPFISIEATGFDKGLFKSTAQSKITLRGETGDEGIPLSHVIYHGPIMLTPMGLKVGSTYIVTTLDLDGLPEDKRRSIDAATGGKPPLTIGMLTGTSENFDLDIDVAPIDTENSAQGALHFDGLTGSLASDLSGSYLRGSIDSGSLRITNASGDEGIDLAPTRIELDVDQMYRGTALIGDVQITTPKLTLKLPQGGKAHAGNLRLISRNRQQSNQTTSSEASFDIQPLALKLPAKGFDIDNGALHFDVALRGIDTDRLKKLIDAGAALQDLNIEAIQNGETNPAVLEQNLQNYLTSFVGLLRPGLETATTFRFSLPQGEAKAALTLDYADNRPVTELATLRDLIGAISGQLEISADEGLLSTLSLQQLAAAPVAMGFAVQENGRLRSNISIRNGVIYINGQPTPFLEMLGPILDEPSPLRGLQGDEQKAV